MNKIYLGDCLEIIKQLPDESINHIITDPPYQISKPNNFHTMKTAKRQGIYFGKWDEEFNPISWIKPTIRLLDKNASMIVFCSYKNMSYLIDEMEKNGMIVKDFIQWRKSNPMPRNVNRRYIQDSEFAIWAVKEKSKWIFNKQKDIPYIRSCIQTPLVSKKEKVGHPTQKSLKLMEEIIKIHTNPKDTILDPFMGGGTTCIACMNLDRKYIGIELDKQYFDIAKERILNQGSIRTVNDKIKM